MPDYTARRTMMVDTQVRPSDVTKFPIIDAMLKIPREAFVPPGKAEAAYMGENIDLGGGRVLLEPRTLAKMLDALNLSAQDYVLTLAAGTGYGAAVLGAMVDAVVAVEEDDALAAAAAETLSTLGADNVAVISAPLVEGAAGQGPFDAILVEGAVEHIPDAILAQVKDGGRIAAIFSEGALGVVRIGYKLSGTVSWRFAFNAGAPILPGFSRPAAFAL